MAKRKQTKKAALATDEILITEAPFSIQEAYKALRTNIVFSLPGGGSKIIGITSATKGEGKSSTALNVAISFAQIGKRVILVDGDMRLPTIASKLRINGRPGLSDILVGEGQIEASIRNVPSMGIHVLPAGNIPPDPTTLLESKPMNTILNVLRKYYDYVLIDLPPVNTVADAAILSRHLDGYLLVARHALAEKREVREMLNQLQLADAKILGFVYNGAPITEKKYYKNYYYRNDATV